MACSWTTTRMRRTGPRARRIRFARFPTPASRRRCTGTRSLTVIPPTSRYSPYRSASRRVGNPHAGMDAEPGSLEKLLELANKDEAAGLGDAPWPPHFRKMEAEGPRVAPSRAKSVSEEGAASENAAHRDCELSRQISRAGGSGKMEEQTSPDSRLFLPRTTCWSTPCEAGLRPGPVSGSICVMCPKHCGRRRKLPTLMTIPRVNGGNGARKRRKKGKE